jgi:hypothetical protein
MTSARVRRARLSPVTPTPLGRDLERAHRLGVTAAVAGLQDAGLGPLRLAGPAVPTLAEAAVTSATPFLRAPLAARISAALLLHPSAGDDQGACPTCGGPSPCPTAQVLRC